MTEIVFTPDRQPVSAVRIVPPTTVRTIGGNPVRAVRVASEADGDHLTAAGYLIESVRLVDAAGLYTVSQTPITTQPEDSFTPDGQPIEHVRLITGASSPELAGTSDGWPISVVRIVGLSGLASDPDAQAWAAQVVTNGGTVSAPRKSVVEQFITAEKAAGTWQLTDDYWSLWAENAAQALTSLKQRRLATATAAPTFTPDRGYAFNGTTQYLDTGFVPSTMAVAMLGTEQRLGVYERTNVSSAGIAIGTSSTSTRRMYVCPGNASTVLSSALNTSLAATFTLPVVDSRGWSVASRAGGGTTVRGFKGGMALTDATGFSIGGGHPSASFYIGAVNNSGTPGSFRASSIGFACAGAPLSDAQEAAQYANVQAWATAIGANV